MGASRQTLLWTLVLFFGASLAFGAVNDLTEGEDALVRVGAQLAALGAILAAVVLFVRHRR
jgi:hypothetical protein